MERFNLFSLQFTLCKSSLDEYILLPCNMPAITTVPLSLLGEGKLQLLQDLCHHPRAFPMRGVQRELEDKYLQQKIPPDFQTSARTEGMKSFFYFFWLRHSVMHLPARHTPNSNEAVNSWISFMTGHCSVWAPQWISISCSCHHVSLSSCLPCTAAAGSFKRKMLSLRGFFSCLATST